MKRLALLAASLLTQTAWAADAQYPTRPVRMIAPFPATSGTDITARQIAQKLSERWRQQVVVDNRPGASGAIGTDLAAKAPPDGYTILMGNAATQSINVSLSKLPYDAQRDFAPITLVARVPQILVVYPPMNVYSVKDLIALGRAKPKQLTFGSAGVGSSPHLAAELFQHLGNVQFVHVPYKGSAPALTDLMGGQIDFFFSNILSALGHVKSGKVRALGVTSANRAAVAPDVPTIAETGLVGYEDYNWYGILAPSRVPKPILDKLHGDLVVIIRSPDFQDRLVRDGAEVVANTPVEFRQFIDSETAKYAQLIKALGLGPTE